MFNLTLSEILRGRWFVDRAWADAQIPMLVNMLKGNTASFVQRSGDMQADFPFAVEPSTMQRKPLFKYIPGEGYAFNPDLPKNTVGVMPITGPVTKYNGHECFADGAIEKNNQLLMLQSHPNISSVVMLIDTPGGEARAAETMTPTLKKFKKPVLSYVDGMAASLGVWFTSATQEVYIGSELGQMGSVGSYCTLFDFSGYLEKEGIKMHEIYAPQSTDKNIEYREALNGNYDRVREDLKVHVDAFIKAVATGGNATRAARAEKKKDMWNTGKLFYAQDAVKAGLADGIASFDKVVAKAAWLAKRNS